VDDAKSDKLTDLVLEMVAELLSLEADGVLGQKCPLLCRNEPATAFYQKTTYSRQKKKLLAFRLLGLIAADISFGVIHDRAKRPRTARRSEVVNNSAVGENSAGGRPASARSRHIAA
jgi:hypothetical protein